MNAYKDSCDDKNDSRRYGLEIALISIRSTGYPSKFSSSSTIPK